METILNIIVGLVLTIGFVDNILKENYFKAITFGSALLSFGYLLRF